MAKKPRTKARPGKSTGAVRRRAPTVIALLLCEGLGHDASTGKFTLYGIFDRVPWQGEQPLRRPLCIYARFVDGVGKQRMSFEILGPNGKPIPLGHEGQEVEFKAGMAVDAASYLGAINLPVKGDYSIFATADGVRIGNPFKFSAAPIDNLLQGRK